MLYGSVGSVDGKLVWGCIAGPLVGGRWPVGGRSVAAKRSRISAAIQAATKASSSVSLMASSHSLSWTSGTVLGGLISLMVRETVPS